MTEAKAWGLLRRQGVLVALGSTVPHHRAAEELLLRFMKSDDIRSQLPEDSKHFFGAGDVKGFERVNRGSGIKCLVYALNVTAQVLFMYMVSSCMMVDPVATDILKALLRFRVGIAHDVAFADRSSFQSMIQ